MRALTRMHGNPFARTPSLTHSLPPSMCALQPLSFVSVYKERMISVIYLVDDVGLSLEASPPVVYKQRPPVLARVRF